jgi:hypothetical protein
VGRHKVAVDQPALRGWLSSADHPHAIEVGGEGLRATVKGVSAHEGVVALLNPCNQALREVAVLPMKAYLITHYSSLTISTRDTIHKQRPAQVSALLYRWF